VLEATVTPILNVIKVTHNRSNNNETLIDKKFLIIRLQYYVIEFGLCPLANRTFLLNFLIFIKKIRYFEVLSIYGVAAATFSSNRFLA
jgi:hypothetical protein